MSYKYKTTHPSFGTALTLQRRERTSARESGLATPTEFLSSARRAAPPNSQIWTRRSKLAND